MTEILNPELWGLTVSESGELNVAGYSTVDLAGRYGTPLQVLNEQRLGETAARFRASAEAAYPGRVSVHYAFKCNSVPAVVQTIRQNGLLAEVMTPFELELALTLGYAPGEIIVNGPCKTDGFLHRCIQAGVRFLIVDSIGELEALNSVLRSKGGEVDILLRINPDYVPGGLPQGSATGSRKGCAFGLDLKGGEVPAAFALLSELEGIHFHGYHFHIGTGVRDPRDYAHALRCLPMLTEQAAEAGFQVRVMDVGGGFASMTTKEFTSLEMLLYQGTGRLPSAPAPNGAATFDDFTRAVSDAIGDCFPAEHLPEIIYEPGRCIASPNQLLLLTVHRVKERPGVGKWLITDGGLGTVTMPTFYEYHEVLLCNDMGRDRTDKVSILGPACFAGDVVYKKKHMPRVLTGEVLAIMDSGAYFTGLESSFGFQRAAIVSVGPEGPKIVRERETFDEMCARDRVHTPGVTRVQHLGFSRGPASAGFTL